MDALPTFGYLVKSHRGKLTQDVFRDVLAAGGLSVTRQALSKWECGTACPTAKTVARLATALRLPSLDRVALLDAAGRFEKGAS